MEIESISNVIKLIGDNGISLVASAILLYFTSKYFKENAEHQKEIINAIILVKEKLVHNYMAVDSLKSYARIHWLRLCEYYKSEVLYYLIKNNIAKNLDNIDNELNKKIDEMLSRTKSLIKNETNGNNMLVIVELVTSEIKVLHKETIETIRAKKSIECVNDKCTTEELARILNNKIEHMQIKGLELIDGLAL